MDSHLNFYPSVEKKANNICNITTKTKFIVDNIYVAFFDNAAVIRYDGVDLSSGVESKST